MNKDQNKKYRWCASFASVITIIALIFIYLSGRQGSIFFFISLCSLFALFYWWADNFLFPNYRENRFPRVDNEVVFIGVSIAAALLISLVLLNLLIISINSSIWRLLAFILLGVFFFVISFSILNFLHKKWVKTQKRRHPSKRKN